jgi:hypothetical protein
MTLLLAGASAHAQAPSENLDEMVRLHQRATEGIKILPGKWRPHYAFEQIAWVRPPWGGDEYLWLDFPEAIFVGQNLHFLSHVNPGIVSMYPELPGVEWQPADGGISFERVLPNGLKFGGSVRQAAPAKVDLHLYLENGTKEPLREITLQTCAFLHGIKEFAELTRDNKFVYVRGKGWVPFETARDTFEPKGKYQLGWRRGPAVADWPVMIVKAKDADHWFGMTWYKDTLSLVGNKSHPCLHADPFFHDLDPGQRADIHGSLLFFEGTLDGLTAFLRQDNPEVFD